jgi:3-oxoacyl-[acyl-carrier-protein] synthase II
VSRGRSPASERRLTHRDAHHWPAVAVTGIGIWTALGHSCATNLRRLTLGEVAFGPSRILDLPGLSERIVAEIDREAVPAWAPQARSRAEHFALVAAEEALVMAGLRAADAEPSSSSSFSSRAASSDEGAAELVVSVSTGGMFETERIITALARHAQREAAETMDLGLWSLDSMAPAERQALGSHAISGVAEALASHLYPFRRATTVCSACSGGALAIGLGLTRLRTGAATRVLVGGVDSLSRLTVAGFGSLQSLDPTSCRPFAADRRGLVLGEGAAFLVLERAATARARGAPILGWVAGYDVRSEAHHITHPEPSGATASRVMVNALDDAGLAANAVDYVSAHGTATQLNDQMEASALLETFGEDLPRLTVSSQKGQLGHTLAAAGAVEAVASLLAMNAGLALPNVMGGPADPTLATKLPLVVLRAETNALGEPIAMPSTARVALSSSFGFGGTDASLVLVRGESDAASSVLPSRAADEPSPGPKPVWLVEAHALVDASADLPASTRCSDLQTSVAALHAERVRRFDRPSRLTTALLGKLLDDVDEADRTEIGLAAGAAYGSSEAAATFFLRVEEKGARFASPADFPNLVPSSAGANAAIYQQLRGPVFSVADLDRSFFAALASAADVVAEGRAEVMIATHIESQSVLAERFLAPAHGLSAGGRPRGEAAAGVRLAGARDDRTSPTGALARLIASGVVRRTGASASSLASLLPPSRDPSEALAKSLAPTRLVLLGLDPVGDIEGTPLHAALLSLGWWAAAREIVPPCAQSHEAAPALQVVQFLDRMARQPAGRTLLLLSSERSVAFLALAPP